MTSKPNPKVEHLKEASRAASERLQQALARLQRKFLEDEIIPEQPPEEYKNGHK